MAVFTWIHLRYNVPHRAIQLVARVLQQIFLALGSIAIEDDTPLTLRTAFTRLGLGDNFDIRPMCATCKRLYPTDTPPDATCLRCHTRLFKTVRDSSLSMISGQPLAFSFANTKSKRSLKPKFQAPIVLPSQRLAELINSTPTMERELEKWRLTEPTPGKSFRVQDGEVWRTLKGPDSRSFFDNSEDRENREELRIGVTLGFDGYSLRANFLHLIQSNPSTIRFGFARSTFSRRHSTGVLSFCVANLDTHLR